MTTEEAKDFGVGSARWWKNRRWMTWISFFVLVGQLPVLYYGLDLSQTQSSVVSGINWALFLIVMGYFGLNTAEQIMAMKK